MGLRTRLPVKVGSVGFLYIFPRICARGLLVSLAQLATPTNVSMFP